MRLDRWVVLVLWVHGCTGFASSNLVLIEGGLFEMGCRNCNLEDALPLHQVELSSFWMDQTPVTNAQFSAFVRRSKYRTMAQTKPNPADYPSVRPEYLVAGSAVFSPPGSAVSLNHGLAWWKYVEGASWRHPEGPATNVFGRQDHPAVHIAFPDAQAYCEEIGMRLPTEAEFEYAARGGLDGKKYAWGDDLKPLGKWAANIWQWTSDWYRPDTYRLDATAGIVRNPRGPSTSHDPFDPGSFKRVQRGGSFLCSDQYCTRYLVGSRGKGGTDSAGSNTGFRCVKDFKSDSGSKSGRHG